ncbi:MAG: hypothetical protein IPL92_04335 [Saprospiraceae bacterium]|nr:hypothetical protein [Candidatus Opimibacter iunctus]
MRHLNLFSALLLTLSALLTTTSCSNSTDNPADLTPTVIQNNVQTGDWKITSYIDSGKDETSHFSGYFFTFNSNGTISATNGSVTNAGTWSLTDSNSNDDTPGVVDFTILFNLGNDFDNLSEDWQILSQTSKKIELKHVSGGNGGTDFLTFEK